VSHRSIALDGTKYHFILEDPLLSPESATCASAGVGSVVRPSYRPNKYSNKQQLPATAPSSPLLMMTLEEGRGLVPETDSEESIIAKCVDNANIWKVRLTVLGLGLANAADAVEVLCVGACPVFNSVIECAAYTQCTVFCHVTGYIMTELGDRVTTEQKGNVK
jgi:hypothetical protein